MAAVINFCRHKLNYQEVVELGNFLMTSYTCGVSFLDLELPGRLKNVCVRDHKCNDSMEKLYYSCSFEPICMKCASENVQPNTEFFPLCPDYLTHGTSPTPYPKRAS